MPAIVAMETSPTQSVRERAARVHVQLSEKHASIIHGKNIDCIKRSFEYQTILSKNNPEKPAILGKFNLLDKLQEILHLSLIQLLIK